MTYTAVDLKLKKGEVVILDGGTGTELEKRGAVMNPGAWCGPATLENILILEKIHRDYVRAGANIITANTYASSRIMLENAGFSEKFEEINRAAISTAKRVRDERPELDIAVAGSLSHMLPMQQGGAAPDFSKLPSAESMAAAFKEVAAMHLAEGCDLIILEMMYHPDRMKHAFAAAMQTGLPVWAGFSARRGANGTVLSFATDRDIPFAETIRILQDFDVAAAGIMHTPADLISDAIEIIRKQYDGPLMAYPDSGYFKMPNWQFVDIISPSKFRQFAQTWVQSGVQIIGGCCGLSPEHIASLGTVSNPSRRP